MKTKIHTLVMAGGIGSRLWPASSVSLPKQFMPFLKGESLFSMTLKRAEKLSCDGVVLIVSLARYADLIREELLKFSEDFRSRCVLLNEPEGRNTAAAIGLGLEYLAREQENNSAVFPVCEDDQVLVLAADHYIPSVEDFSNSLSLGSLLAVNDLVVFGISATGPYTGYGYIKVKEKIENGYKVDRFTEKPSLEDAKKFLSEGGYYWNSGIFLFKISTFREEFRLASPEIAKILSERLSWREERDQRGGYCVISFDDSQKSVYHGIESISIDYALMERSQKIAMVEATFNWDDVGGWDSALELLDQPSQLRGYQSSNLRVFSDLPVCAVGVDDLDIVVKNGVVFLSKRGESHHVREVSFETEE